MKVPRITTTRHCRCAGDGVDGCRSCRRDWMRDRSWCGCRCICHGRLGFRDGDRLRNAARLGNPSRSLGQPRRRSRRLARDLGSSPRLEDSSAVFALHTLSHPLGRNAECLLAVWTTGVNYLRHMLNTLSQMASRGGVKFRMECVSSLLPLDAILPHKVPRRKRATGDWRPRRMGKLFFAPQRVLWGWR